MAFQDRYGNSTDDIQDSADMTDKDYNQRITDRVSELLDDNSDLDDAIINDEQTLQAIRALYRAHATGQPLQVWCTTICMNIDSYLINRATKELI